MGAIIIFGIIQMAMRDRRLGSRRERILNVAQICGYTGLEIFNKTFSLGLYRLSSGLRVTT
jgi:hypothetical protein